MYDSVDRGGRDPLGTASDREGLGQGSIEIHCNCRARERTVEWESERRAAPPCAARECQGEVASCLVLWVRCCCCCNLTGPDGGVSTALGLYRLRQAQTI